MWTSWVQTGSASYMWCNLGNPRASGQFGLILQLVILYRHTWATDTETGTLNRKLNPWMAAKTTVTTNNETYWHYKQWNKTDKYSWHHFVAPSDEHSAVLQKLLVYCIYLARNTRALKPEMFQNSNCKVITFVSSTTWHRVTYSKYTHAHAHTSILRPFFRDHPGEPEPEENFWTLWCKERLTEADTLTIRLGATPAGLTSAHLHHPPFFYRPDALPAT